MDFYTQIQNCQSLEALDQLIDPRTMKMTVGCCQGRRLALIGDVEQNVRLKAVVYKMDELEQKLTERFDTSLKPLRSLTDKVVAFDTQGDLLLEKPQNEGFFACIYRIFLVWLTNIREFLGNLFWNWRSTLERLISVQPTASKTPTDVADTMLTPSSAFTVVSTPKPMSLRELKEAFQDLSDSAGVSSTPVQIKEDITLKHTSSFSWNRGEEPPQRILAAADKSITKLAGGISLQANQFIEGLPPISPFELSTHVYHYLKEWTWPLNTFNDFIEKRFLPYLVTRILKFSIHESFLTELDIIVNLRELTEGAALVTPAGTEEPLWKKEGVQLFRKAFREAIIQTYKILVQKKPSLGTPQTAVKIGIIRADPETLTDIRKMIPDQSIDTLPFNTVWNFPDLELQKKKEGVEVNNIIEPPKVVEYAQPPLTKPAEA